MKRKVANVLLAAIVAIPLFLCSLSGCGKTEESEKPPQTEKDMVRVIGDGTGTTLKNKKVSVKFDAESGSLIGLSAGDRPLLGEEGFSEGEGLPYGNFTLYVDVNTGDKWETSASEANLVRVTSRSQKVVSEVEDVDGGKRLRLRWQISFGHAGRTYEGIAVGLDVDVKDGSAETEWRYSLKNDCAGVTVVSMVAAQVGGIAESNEFSLFYPMLEGELHADAVGLAKNGRLRAAKDGYVYGVKNARALSVSYPGSLSMQLMQLYNAERGVYLYSRDLSNEYKKLNFGIFDGANGYDGDTSAGASLSLTCYPFAEPGEETELAPVTLGVQEEGGWYAGSDSYRARLLGSDIRFRNYGETVKNFSGMIAAVATPSNQRPTMAYDKDKISGFASDISTTLLDVDNYGFDNMMLLGWNDKGFDTMYPDFTFMDAMGGEAAFRSGVAKAQDNGDKVIAYLNAYSVNGDSEWSKAGNWETCAVKDENGGKYTMGWGQSAFTAMCPMSAGYSSALISAAERLARNGVNGLFFDQLMEMPATLCYDRAHGHRTPATAYGEGYDKVFKGIHAEMRKYAEDYIFMCEGVNDAYIRYVDLPVGMWARLLKYRLNTADENNPDIEPIYSMPEITRYTIPTKILGIQNEDGSSVEMNEHSYAFMMGEPLLRSGGSTNAMMPRLISVYEQYPDIYGRSVYIHERGITAAAGLQAGAVVGENRFIVTVYNPTDSDVTGNVALDLEKIGYGGRTVDSIRDVLETGITKRFKDGAFAVEVGSRKFASYLITLQ